jgi:copper oxidase (laccase) domain-containing protein
VSAAEIQVWLGPCIGHTNFEVGEEVRAAFVCVDADAAACFVPHPSHAGKWLANLPALARLRLRALGITAVVGNDGTLAWCTVMQSSRLFSFRRDGATGRFAACIWRSVA